MHVNAVMCTHVRLPQYTESPIAKATDVWSDTRRESGVGGEADIREFHAHAEVEENSETLLFLF
jgi:hypothetical protein